MLLYRCGEITQASAWQGNHNRYNCQGCVLEMQATTAYYILHMGIGWYYDLNLGSKTCVYILKGEINLLKQLNHFYDAIMYSHHYQNTFPKINYMRQTLPTGKLKTRSILKHYSTISSLTLTVDLLLNNIGHDIHINWTNHTLLMVLWFLLKLIESIRTINHYK